MIILLSIFSIQICSAYVKPWILSESNNPLLQKVRSNPMVFNTTVSFPSSLSEKILRAEPGDFVLSESFGAKDGPRFCVKLYPKGEYTTGTSSSGACVSLQYLAEEPKYYDTTFCLRWTSKISGCDIEWKGGKRFGAYSELSISDEYPCCCFRSQEVPSFLYDVFSTCSANMENNNDKELIKLGAEMTIHGSGIIKGNDRRVVSNKTKWWKSWQEYRKIESEEENWIKTGFKAAQFHDVRSSEDLRVGSVIIPLLSTQVEGVLPERVERPLRILVSTLFSATVLGGSWVNVPSLLMKQHRSMWEKGVYPGVDYEITRIVDREQEAFYHSRGVDYEVKPIYALGAILDRKWPVKINEAEIPNLISPLQYNIATAIGALTASASILVGFFFVSLVSSLFFIPSRSMEPTLNVGDVLLVEKVTPRLPFLNYKPGDVVMFQPPSALRDLVEANGGKLSSRDLFVKRVAAVAGDVVEVGKNGDVKVTNGVENRQTPIRSLCTAEPLGLIKKYVKPGVTVVPPNKVLLLGDCSSVSVDGRVWGTLDTNDIVGRPILRTWPPSKMSKIPDLPTVESQWKD